MNSTILKSKNGNLIELKQKCCYQTIRPARRKSTVDSGPTFLKSLAITAGLPVSPGMAVRGRAGIEWWDTLSLNADIDVSGKGFAGCQV